MEYEKYICFNLVLPTCGKIYTTTTGKIRSPPVPSLLPHPVECHWNVRVPRAKVIDINVLISWERNAKCSNYLRLQYKSGGREVVLTFCGKEDVKENILIKRNNLLIKYHVEVRNNAVILVRLNNFQYGHYPGRRTKQE